MSPDFSLVIPANMNSPLAAMLSYATEEIAMRYEDPCCGLDQSNHLQHGRDDRWSAQCNVWVCFSAFFGILV